MKQKHLDFDQYLGEALKDVKVRRDYEALQPEFELIGALIEARQERGYTQEMLAKKMGTTQSVVARLESGKANPSLKSLHKMAEALSVKFELRFLKADLVK